ncbi:hypothetical protein [Hymenobacter radiodurans]|uniref:hypothetical protein n=1 Tax=Hymenobacter radiodurans TaxID=2496028 RepID=UPI001F0E5195|nr:hypothetical protein [Hymenobacter radiodurans]
MGHHPAQGDGDAGQLGLVLVNAAQGQGEDAGLYVGELQGGPHQGIGLVGTRVEGRRRGGGGNIRNAAVTGKP